MFKNVGNKIRVFAKVLFVLEVIIASFYFLAQLFVDGPHGIALIITCILCVAFCVLVSWAKNVVLYAFGDLVDNSSKIKNDLEATKALNEELLEKVSNLENKE